MGPSHTTRRMPLRCGPVPAAQLDDLWLAQAHGVEAHTALLLGFRSIRPVGAAARNGRALLHPVPSAGTPVRGLQSCCRPALGCPGELAAEAIKSHICS